MKRAAQISLCYDYHDERRAMDLQDRLKCRGFQSWIDRADPIGSEQWALTVRKVLPASDFVLICLSHNSINQYGMLGRELAIAMDALITMPTAGTHAIYLCLDEVKIPNNLPEFMRIDLFREGGWQQLISYLCSEVERLGLIRPVKLRTTPRTLNSQQLDAMIREQDYYDGLRNSKGRGIDHQYELLDLTGEKVILDHTTGLCWQQDGSHHAMKFANTDKYILELNVEGFAGCNGWRMPTLEEAMSLVEPKQAAGSGLFVDAKYNKKQLWIWTADQSSAMNLWIVYFYYGHCRVQNAFGSCFVRAVRPIDEYLMKKAARSRRKTYSQPVALAAF